MDILMGGIAFGESPRWHDGRVWVSDWGAGRVHSVSADGTATVEAEVASFPLCFDFLPDGRLLLVSSADRKVLRREEDGSLVTHADLAPVSTKPWNDVVVDDRGNAYVNNIGFALGKENSPDGDYAPGIVVLVTPGGAVAPVADGLAFPNGMAVTADGTTLVVAESYAEQLTAFTIAAEGNLTDRRVWAPTPGDHPDGICIDATGAVWYADVANGHCIGVAEGGEVLGKVEFDRGAFACVLSRDDDPQLFVVGQNFGADGGDEPSGRLASFPAPSPGAGHP